MGVNVTVAALPILASDPGHGFSEKNDPVRAYDGPAPRCPGDPCSE